MSSDDKKRKAEGTVKSFGFKVYTGVCGSGLDHRFQLSGGLGHGLWVLGTGLTEHFG